MCGGSRDEKAELPPSNYFFDLAVFLFGGLGVRPLFPSRDSVHFACIHGPRSLMGAPFCLSCCPLGLEMCIGVFSMGPNLSKCFFPCGGAGLP